MNHRSRMRQLRAVMAKRKIAALLVTHLPDVRYLCGFTGSNAALAITAKAALLVTDGRYTAQAAAEVKGAEVRIAKGPAVPEACRWLAAARVKRAYYDGEQTTVSALGVDAEGGQGRRRIEAVFPPLAVSAGCCAAHGEGCGARSNAWLLRLRLGVRLFEHILGFKGRAGHRRRMRSRRSSSIARGCGARRRCRLRRSWPAASDRRCRMARHPRRSCRGAGFVTLDFGVILNGYCSDMTRTVHLGRATRARARGVRCGAGSAGDRGRSGERRA